MSSQSLFARTNSDWSNVIIALCPVNRPVKLCRLGSISYHMHTCTCKHTCMHVYTSTHTACTNITCTNITCTNTPSVNVQHITCHTRCSLISHRLSFGKAELSALSCCVVIDRGVSGRFHRPTIPHLWERTESPVKPFCDTMPRYISHKCVYHTQKVPTLEKRSQPKKLTRGLHTH